MLPKIHIIYGVIASLLLYYLFPITPPQATLFFLASFLIDFDHYTWYVCHKKDWSLKNAYNLLKGLKKHKPMMAVFHTIEFLILFAIISYSYPLLWFVFYGMLFHSVLDIAYLIHEGRLNCREFSLIRYLIFKRKYPDKYLR